MCAWTSVPRNVNAEFIQQHLKGNPVFGRWSLANQQSATLLRDFRGQLRPTAIAAQADVAAKLWGAGVNNLTWSEGPAAQVANMLYLATKVQGVWEWVPPKLQGVFWMKGNGVPEELATLQLSSWFEAEQLSIGVMAPFSWAWAVGRPASAPFWGALYRQPWQRVFSAGLVGDGMPGTVDSIKFGTCPSGSACQEGSVGLTYGSIEGHPRGDLNAIGAILPGFTSKFTLEEIPGASQPGSHWKRGCWWGIGACRFLEFGSYDLLKIIDGNGKEVEPFYSEFMQYIADVPLFVWSGFNTTV